MKKLFAMFLVMTLTISILSTAFGACALHGRTYGVDIGSPSISYASSGDRTHVKTVTQKVQCFQCGDYWCESNPSYENHTFSFRNKRHNYSNSTHAWERYCTVCSYSKTTTYSCSGNPCVQPQSIPGIPTPELY